MAQKTALSVLAIPGRVLSFLAKSISGPHNPGKITQLSPGAYPGQRYSFIAKVIAGPHNPGHITDLAVYALPGAVHLFEAKSPAVVGVSRGRHIGRLIKGIIGV